MARDERAVRNIGRDGLAATAISAVDTALWDLKAQAARICRSRRLLGRIRDARADLRQRRLHHLHRRARCASSLRGWVERDGCRWVKMKIGTDPERDPQRVARGKARDRRARAVRRRQRRLSRASRRSHLAEIFAHEADVRWFEEPVSSDDLAGLALDARARARAHGDRRGRIRLHTRLFPPHARSRRRRRAAGGCDALRRLSPAFCGRRALRSASHRSVGALRARAASARRLRGAAPAPSRMVSRPRPHRAHAVRRRARAERWHDRAGSLAARASGSRSSSRMRSASVSASESHDLRPASRRRDGRARASRGVVGVGVAALSARGSCSRRSQRRAPSHGEPRYRDGRRRPTVTAARRLNRAAGMLAFSVLADSAIEHYRGSFHNRAMYTPLVVSSADARGQRAWRRRSTPGRASPCAMSSTSRAALTGARRHRLSHLQRRARPGGFSWQNLFYGAPLGAPARSCFPGLLGFMAERVRDTGPAEAPSISRHAGRPAHCCRRLPLACWAPRPRPHCCIFAAPSTTRSCFFPSRCRRRAAARDGRDGAGQAGAQSRRSRAGGCG